MLKRVIAISMLISTVFNIIFSNNYSYANEMHVDENNYLGKYIESKESNKDDYPMNSDEYIQFLIDNKIDFEITDLYYKKIEDINMTGNTIQNMLQLNGDYYIESKVKTAKNSIPGLYRYNDGELRVREVKYSLFDVPVDFKEGSLQIMKGTAISVLSGVLSKTHPLIGFILFVADQIPYSEPEYGWISSTVKNNHVDSNVWHEVYDGRDFTVMVITESRMTNVIYNQSVTNKNTGFVTSVAEDFNGIYYQYSIYFGQLTRNLQEALNRYNAGITFPNLYRYSTGTFIDNSIILPR